MPSALSAFVTAAAAATVLYLVPSETTTVESVDLVATSLAPGK
jgi:hypothetical protein